MINDQVDQSNEQPIDKTLWSDENNTRQFIIPDKLHPSNGYYVIRTATDKIQQVIIEDIKEFEVTKEEANAWLKGQFKSVMGQLKAGLKKSFFNSSPENDNTNKSKQDKAGSEKENKKTSPGLDLLADITKTPRDTMDNNYSAIGHALQTYLKDMTSTVTDAVSGEPDRQESAQERMKVWGKTLQEHGIKVPDVDVKESKPNENNQQAKDTKD